MEQANRPKRVIVNADDFGLSPGVTEGILRAHIEGVVTSTTVMANMPAAGEAVARLGEAPDLGVGLHLNLSQGRPLSAEGAALAGSDGVFRNSGVGLILACVRRPRLLDAVQAECDAQIRWMIDRALRPTHIDSHRHAHAFPPIFTRVARLARRHDIPFVRWPCEHLPAGWAGGGVAARCVSRLLDCFALADALRAPGLRGTRGTWGLVHTGRIDRAFLIAAARAVRPGVTEIMTHPGLPDGLDPAMTRLLESRATELEALCDPAVRQAFRDNHIGLTHYGRLRGDAAGAGVSRQARVP